MSLASPKRYLLDTHVFLWLIQDTRRVDPVLLDEIRDPSNDVVFSAVVAWEIATKRAKGKLNFAGSPSEYARRAAFRPLSIHADHCERASALPRIHPDPFDRLLIAQAEIEGLILVSSDTMIGRYSVAVRRI